MVFFLIVFKVLFSRGQGTDEFNLNVWSIICECIDNTRLKNWRFHSNLCFIWRFHSNLCFCSCAGEVLLKLGKLQFELQKLLDTYVGHNCIHGLKHFRYLYLGRDKFLNFFSSVLILS